MDYLSALIYGLIQGLTEFLPVSSSGHLALLPFLLDIEDPGVLFDLSMHFGTALSIIVYFRKEVKRLLSDTFSLLTAPQKYGQYSLAVNMIISTIGTVLWVVLLKDFAEEFGRNPLVIAFNLLLFGLFMFVADYFGTKKETQKMEQFQWVRAIMVGTFQAFAIFPGVSRSGATLTISRFIGMSREEATRYSFLLSLPIIIAGFVYKFPEIVNGNSTFSLSTCFFGVAVSFIVGLVTIHFFLKFIKKMGLFAFSFYRVILAGVIWWVA